MRSPRRRTREMRANLQTPEYAARRRPILPTRNVDPNYRSRLAFYEVRPRSRRRPPRPAAARCCRDVLQPTRERVRTTRARTFKAERRERTTFRRVDCDRRPHARFQPAPRCRPDRRATLRSRAERPTIFARTPIFPPTSDARPERFAPTRDDHPTSRPDPNPFRTAPRVRRDPARTRFHSRRAPNPTRFERTPTPRRPAPALRRATTLRVPEPVQTRREPFRAAQTPAERDDAVSLPFERAVERLARRDDDRDRRRRPTADPTTHAARTRSRFAAPYPDPNPRRRFAAPQRRASRRREPDRELEPRRPTARDRCDASRRATRRTTTPSFPPRSLARDDAFVPTPARARRPVPDTDARANLAVRAFDPSSGRVARTRLTAPGRVASRGAFASSLDASGLGWARGTFVDRRAWRVDSRTVGSRGVRVSVGPGLGTRGGDALGFDGVGALGSLATLEALLRDSRDYLATLARAASTDFILTTSSAR